MRLGVLGFYHEANTFAAPGRLRAFARGEVVRGRAIITAHEDSQTTIAGFLEGCNDVRATAVPLVFASATPSGVVTAGAFERLVGEMTRRIRETGPWDGLLLALHGAAASESYLDADGEILHRLRREVGSVPIGVGFDMHANMSDQMVSCADILVGYRTNPHVDARARGREVAHLVAATVRGEIRPTMAYSQVPAVISITKQGTDSDPMARLLADLQSSLATPRVLSGSIVQGYPYADVPDMGMSVVVVTDGDEHLAAVTVDRLACAVWAHRYEFVGAVEDIHSAFTRTLRDRTGRPVLLLDVGDNVGGGAPGSSVLLLAHARRLGIGPTLGIVVDRKGAELAHDVGVGERFSAHIGQGPAEKLIVDGVVTGLTNGRFEESVTSHGGQRLYDAGPSAAIRDTCGDTIVLTSRPVIPSSLRQLTTLGIAVADFRVVVAKGVNSPLAAYGPECPTRLFVDTPGPTSADLSGFGYVRRRRPLFPFEPQAEFTGSSVRIRRANGELAVPWDSER